RRPRVGPPARRQGRLGARDGGLAAPGRGRRPARGPGRGRRRRAPPPGDRRRARARRRRPARLLRRRGVRHGGHGHGATGGPGRAPDRVGAVMTQMVDVVPREAVGMRQEMHVDHDEQVLDLRVSRMTWESEGVLSLELRRPDGMDIPAWQPSAHLDLQIPRVSTRQYSLCGSPDERSVWRIVGLRELYRKCGSQSLHESVWPGYVVSVVGTMNMFHCVFSPFYVFIAGGIGITPILPMIAAADAAGASWSLL